MVTVVEVAVEAVAVVFLVVVVVLLIMVATQWQITEGSFEPIAN